MILPLNHQLHPAQQTRRYPPLLLIHGLFGSLDNLGLLARDLKRDRDVLQVDLRNHGLSGHTPQMSYDLMAEDLAALIADYDLPPCDIVGHSMGGKAAMRLAVRHPQRLRRLAILDMAPVAYPTRRHDAVFAALYAVQEAALETRSAAATCLRHYLQSEGVVQFLLKSFHRGQWRFNLPALYQHYPAILGWDTQPPYAGEALFIKGANSPYILDDYRTAIIRQFPRARAHVIHATGHWLHAEQPEKVLHVLHRFLDAPEHVG